MAFRNNFGHFGDFFTKSDHYNSWPVQPPVTDFCIQAIFMAISLHAKFHVPVRFKRWVTGTQISSQNQPYAEIARKYFYMHTGQYLQAKSLGQCYINWQNFFILNRRNLAQTVLESAIFCLFSELDHLSYKAKKPPSILTSFWCVLLDICLNWVFSLCFALTFWHLSRAPLNAQIWCKRIRKGRTWGYHVLKFRPIGKKIRLVILAISIGHLFWKY